MATTTVDAGEGTGAIQSALDGASAGDTVEVTGSGNYSWSNSLEVPNGVTLSVSNSVTVTVPASNSITAYSTGSRQVYSLITCADRSGASNVVIEGGEYDLSEMTQDDGGYAGVWLHNASDSLIYDVVVRGAGAPIDRTYRGFGIALTRCTNCEIRESEAHNASYDNIAVRGGCEGCQVTRSGGTGGSSGTIQTARWGYWGLDDAPRNTTFQQCWGRRIYDHDGISTTWDGCQTTDKLQTLGTDDAVFRNSGDFEGTVLIYTYDTSTPNALIEAMEFVNAGQKDIAIQVAPNQGQGIGTVEVSNVWAERPIFLGFQNDHIDPGADIGTVEVTDSTIIGAGSSATIMTQASDAPEADTVIFRNCEFYDFATGFTGNYGTLVVENCTFNGIENPFADVSADSIQRSGNTFGDAQAPSAGDGPWTSPGGGSGGAGTTTTRSIIAFNEFDNVQHATSGTGSATAFTLKKSVIGAAIAGDGVTVAAPGGETIQVRQCTFEAPAATEVANIHIHGVPATEGTIEQTWHQMGRPELAIRQSEGGEIIADADRGGFESLTLQNNVFSEAAPSDTSIGAQEFR